MQALDSFMALECELNERMFFGLWPSCRIYGSTKSLLFAMTVASGCKSCIQADQYVTLANNTACIAVATPKEKQGRSKNAASAFAISLPALFEFGTEFLPPETGASKTT